MTHKNMFAQVYLNGSDAGDTYIIPTGNTIVDNSSLAVAQFQHDLTYDKLRLTYGVDFY